MSTIVQVSCLCGKNLETLQLKTQLPVSVSPCSCNICRYSSSVLYFSCLPIPSRPHVLQNLTEYKSSSKLSRYFCPACGSHMFIHAEDPDSWAVCSGVVERVVGHEQGACLSLEKIVQHEFVSDTKDGGLAICLAGCDGHSVPLFSQGPDGVSFERPTATCLPALGPHIHPVVAAVVNDVAAAAIPKSEISAGCHCGGAAFRVTRPNLQSNLCSSPFPDLLVPYHSSSSDNPQDIKWWLRASGSKYLAGTCACRSCRLGSGSPVQCWSFIPKANILQSDGSPLTYEMGTLKQIESSKDCFREFCRVCGATLFWHCRERPDLVDVSVGLLRANEGSRAESLLEWWTERVSFREDALDQSLIRDLERGLRNLEPKE
jgi:hypothetical protein